MGPRLIAYRTPTYSHSKGDGFDWAVVLVRLWTSVLLRLVRSRQRMSIGISYIFSASMISHMQIREDNIATHKPHMRTRARVLTLCAATA